MSHHFDTQTGLEDPRLNLGDFYLFQGGPGRTIMAMTANPQATATTPAPFRDEGIYAFRFDTDGDGHEDVTFKVRFGDVIHREGQPDHAQRFEVRRAAGPDADHGVDGEVVADGVTNEVGPPGGTARAYAGVARDAFAGNGVALETYEKAFAAGRYTTEAFQKAANLFDSRQIGVIVLDVPTELIGDGHVHAWTTVSLYGHAPEMQVARWGLPLITHMFIRDPDMREDYNRTAPSADNTRFTDHIADVVRETTKLAGSTNDPEAYARRVVDTFGRMTLPYDLGSTASFDYTGFNGRVMTDDVMDVMLTLMTNTALGDGVAPDPSLIRPDFPYFTSAQAVSA
jgi:hypothetical protein